MSVFKSMRTNIAAAAIALWWAALAYTNVAFALPIQTTIALSVIPANVYYGQDFSFTATISGANSATGTVSLCEGPIVADTNCTGGVLVATLPVFANVPSVVFINPPTDVAETFLHFSAIYSGDANNAGSISSSIEFVRYPALTTTHIVSVTPNNPTIGESVLVTVQVTGTSPNSPIPQGYIGVGTGQIGCTIEPLVDGQGSCAFTPTGFGRFTLFAEYVSTDLKFLDSSSNIVLAVSPRQLEAAPLSSVFCLWLALFLAATGWCRTWSRY